MGHHQDPTFWQWLGRFKLIKLIGIIFLILLLVSLLIHYYLVSMDQRSMTQLSHSAHSHKYLPEEMSFKDADLEIRVKELLRIKGSVSGELREMEHKRQRLQMDIQVYAKEIEQLKVELLHQQTELSRLKISVHQAQVALQEALQQNTPDLALPRRLVATDPPISLPAPHYSTIGDCRMDNCFDHSRCSLTSGFPVYLYDPDLHPMMSSGWDVDGFLKTTLKQVLGYNPHLTSDPNEACVYLVLVGEALRDDNDDESGGDAEQLLAGGDEEGMQGIGGNISASRQRAPLDESALRRLPYWGGDGRNHVLLNLARRELSATAADVFTNVNTGRAILVQSTYTRRLYRTDFDVVVAPVLGPPGGDVWSECAPMLPARRKYLLTFQGEMKMPAKFTGKSESFQGAYNTSSQFQKRSSDMFSSGADEELNEFIISHLNGLMQTTTQDKFKFEFECNPASDNNKNTGQQDWALCGTDTSRRALLRESTFVLIFAPGCAPPHQADVTYSPWASSTPKPVCTHLLSTTLLQARIYEALRSGAIPVVLGGDQVRLAFDEVIQWRRLCILVPRARITELHFLIRTFPDADLLAMRRQGRMVWERYLASAQSILDTVLALLRHRLYLPAVPAESVAALSVFNDTFQPAQMIMGIQAGDPDQPEESLGPLEPSYNSPTYRRNYSLLLTQGAALWNDGWGDPFRLYTALPQEPVLPSDAKFMGSENGFRPIAQGQGGSGKEFSEALGGNHPREQFTVLVLTYEREQVLLDSVARLRGLPYLNSVVVVWNSPRPPSPDLRWPDIGVPLHVIRAARNSLNNRFLPLENIMTEAVLSVDDDAHLRHDEILFGFRVWREHRDRIVGFPGRYHAWDINTQSSWLYNSNYSCELSMVLTGAAFIHNHYLHLYWKWLPQAIRDKVDEYMNCEDIAMNFLVSHITRAPPIKVTSRWTFRCPGCPQSLSEDETHFQERHKCINFFVQVFGYMPLLNTQYRADSILFKTRIPHDKQKCFKFI